VRPLTALGTARARAATRSRAPVRIGAVEAYEADGLCGVRADVDGVPVFFETDGPPLSPSPEAFGSAVLPAALAAGRGLSIEPPVDERWRRGAVELTRVFRAWWGWPEAEIEGPLRPEGDSPPAAGTALCFSGGVDSFHALLRCPERIDAIATVFGYDMPLSHAARRQALCASLDAVATARGVRSVRIRTDLREHPLLRGLDWERGHGGALAAVGHLTSARRLVIASSIPAGDETPWGSHWKTDASWSSSTTTVVPWGQVLRRDQKLRDVCREPLVQAHLRVCWENRARVGNCSRCVKCLRTALILLDEGVLDRHPGFASAAQMPALLHAVPTARRRWRAFDELLSKRSLPADVHEALVDLDRRTKAAHRPLGRVLAWWRRRSRR
jgi:hypothetical protein